MVGILVADGSERGGGGAVRKAVEKDRRVCKIVGAKVGGAKMADGKMLKADGQLAAPHRKSSTPSQSRFPARRF